LAEPVGTPHAGSRQGVRPEAGGVDARQPRAHTRPQRGGHGDLAIPDFAKGAGVLALHADRMPALFRKPGVIEDQHAVAIRDTSQEAPPHGDDVPRRVRDEMLKAW
jgi:hypothetical protein